MGEDYPLPEYTRHQTARQMIVVRLMGQLLSLFPVVEYLLALVLDLGRVARQMIVVQLMGQLLLLFPAVEYLLALVLVELALVMVDNTNLHHPVLALDLGRVAALLVRMDYKDRKVLLPVPMAPVLRPVRTDPP